MVGVANEHSIAFGCAAKLRAFGAELAITYLNEKSERFVRPLAEQVEAGLILPLDVEQPGQIDEVFDRIRAEWGGLDFVIHSIAFAPREDLHGQVTDCSLAGFPASDAGVLLFIHRTGQARRAVNDAWRRAFNDELLWRQQGRQ